MHQQSSMNRLIAAVTCSIAVALPHPHALAMGAGRGEVPLLSDAVTCAGYLLEPKRRKSQQISPGPTADTRSIHHK